jgi:hypothetical protein
MYYLDASMYVLDLDEDEDEATLVPSSLDEAKVKA